jgi:hypothetical protein
MKFDSENILFVFYKKFQWIASFLIINCFDIWYYEKKFYFTIGNGPVFM